MIKWTLTSFVILLSLVLLGCSTPSTLAASPFPPPPPIDLKLPPPPAGKIYHAAYPDFGGWEDEVSGEKIADFEELAGRNITWAYFSNNWWQPDPGIHFPTERVREIYASGRLPFIRMMPRTEDPETGDMALPDPYYSMQSIIDGQWDEDLRQWAQDAKAVGLPLLVEFGTEVNGNWFPWNAEWNGADSTDEYGDPQLYDGMERFRDAYRHIIDICNQEGADNITWFFHVDAYNDPEEDWNVMAGYYPGDDYIDWIGVSVYGPQEPGEGWWLFSDVLSDSWDEIMDISAEGKPIAILEWGVIDYPEIGSKAEWIDDAFATLLSGDYPEIKAISYWHENFDETNLRIDSSPEALAAYRRGVAHRRFIAPPDLINLPFQEFHPQ